MAFFIDEYKKFKEALARSPYPLLDLVQLGSLVHLFIQLSQSHLISFISTAKAFLALLTFLMIHTYCYFNEYST